MALPSILFDDSATALGRDAASREAPEFFEDLRLDQIVEAICAERGAYDLPGFFYVPLESADGIAYRHEVFRDLERPEVRAQVEAFASGMRTMRGKLAQAEKLHHEHQKARWLLDASATYCGIVRDLRDGLERVPPKARGLLGIREHLRAYVASDAFTSLAAEGQRLADDLAGIAYRMQIKGSRVTVSRYEEEPDYSAEIEATFERFRQGPDKSYKVDFPNFPSADSVESRILDRVAKLFPDIFGALHAFWTSSQEYVDPTLERFDREVQFYLGYLGFIVAPKAAGLAFCYPEVSRAKAEEVRRAFDLALAHMLVHEGKPVVANDFRLDGPQRILVVSGPNQGGKTTFARMFGQLHYMARLGLPVPGEEARLFLCDRIFTHFEREESVESQQGRLRDELVRIHDMLQEATSDSVVIMNETFASTTLEDAVILGGEALRRITASDMLGVYVTFVDELSRLSEATVSMVSTVRPEDPALRTYEIVRRPADGLAYAMALAQRHGLTYEALKRRIAP